MFTTWQPMAEAEFKARFRFSCEAKTTIAEQVRRKKKRQPSSNIHVPTCVVNSVSFFLLMVLSSMVSGTDRLIILLCRTAKTLRLIPSMTKCHH